MAAQNKACLLILLITIGFSSASRHMKQTHQEKAALMNLQGSGIEPAGDGSGGNFGVGYGSDVGSIGDSGVGYGSEGGSSGDYGVGYGSGGDDYGVGYGPYGPGGSVCSGRSGVGYGFQCGGQGCAPSGVDTVVIGFPAVTVPVTNIPAAAIGVRGVLMGGGGVQVGENQQYGNTQDGVEYLTPPPASDLPLPVPGKF